MGKNPSQLHNFLQRSTTKPIIQRLVYSFIQIFHPSIHPQGTWSVSQETQDTMQGKSNLRTPPRHKEDMQTPHTHEGEGTQAPTLEILGKHASFK